MTSLMATHSDHDLKVISPKGVATKRQDGSLSSPRQQKAPHHLNSDGKEHASPSNRRPRESNGGSAASFSTNNNSVVCLPLVSEGLKLVWTQSDQTRELDGIPELVQAFNIFPYPTSQEVSTLARVCALPLDKVKVWFMVQRIKYGISWASEDIEETRLKLARPVQTSETEHKESSAKRKSEIEDLKETEDHIEDLAQSPQVPRKRHKIESTEPAKLFPAPARFRSSLPPPQDSYYYRQPVEIPETPQAATPPTSTESPVGSEQPRHGRYKKSKAQLAALRKSFLQENWPDETELQRLQEETGLTRNEIRKWFSDSRYQLRNGRGLMTSFSVTQGEKNEPNCSLSSQSQEVQPLPLIAKKQTTEHADDESKEKVRVKGSRKNRPKNSQFFQLFLSNTLEAFEEGAIGVEEEKCSEESEIQNNEPGSEQESEGRCLTPPEPAAPTSSSSSPSVTPSKKHSGKSSKSARPVKVNALNNSLNLSDNTSPSSVLTAAGRPRKTKEQLAVLKEFFQRCPWPKSDVYTQIVELTSLPRADVIQWFGDTRYAVKNGHVRWVHADVRDQVLAEIALLQSGGAAGDATGTIGTPGSEGNRKRKSLGNSTPKTQKSAMDSVDLSPLEQYYRQTGPLQEKDLDNLCRKSKMSYQQVRDWFASQDSTTLDTEVTVID
ncbi:homeobox and leucine zipper Homez [Labeo rohita]|uniref:Homeobox and leucine zipper Homez n=2 Tax=Labeo rohita TaxID=84645 RepID=A0A498L4W7_LABRO|nr:homeobox and leucine zipper encoding a [Labeo rohita]KAI2667758.1 Zinc fingers and homeoboxes protein 1 [Labeo rohita]RXN03441.1 homeobox and leucine zipper Homez [Labeo rohita]RXN30964.1 homeobox and leucine zipper Homez [Labeo rohita]